jgi:hypothetical protein
MVLCFAKFLICRVYWTIANNTTPLLLWWLGWAIFCGVGGLVFVKVGVVAYVSAKAECFWLVVCFSICWIQWLFYKPTKFVDSNQTGFSPWMIFFSSSCRSLVLEKVSFRASIPPQMLVIMTVSSCFYTFKGFYVFDNSPTCPQVIAKFRQITIQTSP